MANNVSAQKKVSTPAYCAAAVRWCINETTDEKYSFYAQMGIKLFTAFLFEGILHEIGWRLCIDWTKKNEEGKEIGFERKTIFEKHQKIRQYLDLKNNTTKYQNINNILKELVSFRDSLAHPKVIEENNIRTSLGIDGYPIIPEIGWVKQVQIGMGKEEFSVIEAYLQSLLDLAHDRLEGMSYNYEYIKSHPQLHGKDLHEEAIKVKTLMTFLESHSASY